MDEPVANGVQTEERLAARRDHERLTVKMLCYSLPHMTPDTSDVPYGTLGSRSSRHSRRAASIVERFLNITEDAS